MTKKKQALTTASKMTTGERQELGKLVRQRAKVAEADAEARAALLLADAEAKLAAIYKSQDAAWAEITVEAEKAVADADAAIAARCRERGIPENFRPEIGLHWYGRGENASKERRAELRKVAQTHVTALVKEAKLAIARESVHQLEQLAATGLTSHEASAFLGNMPAAEDLLPPIGALKLPNGELVSLEFQAVAANRNPVVTIERNSVTVERNGVTEQAQDRNACPTCGEALAPGRGRYCSNACRQAAYRARRG